MYDDGINIMSSQDIDVFLTTKEMMGKSLFRIKGSFSSSLSSSL